MSDGGGDRPNDELSGLGLGAGGGGEMEVESPRRAASLTLRDEGESGARAASLEAAQRSLSDALRITYRLMQLLIVALVLLFLFSGFRQVGENQSAVKTRFGAVVERDIEPGFTISLPYPLGEVRTVESSDEVIEINGAFFPALTASQRGRDFASLPGRGDRALDPRAAGSLITGDRNLAHARFRVTYRRADATEYLRNLVPEDEARLVANSVQAAAVRVAAGVPIGSLVGGSLAGLSDSGTGEVSLEEEGAASLVDIEEVQRRVRELAQSRLDALDTGLLVSSVIAVEPYPPQRVLAEFRAVDRAISEARTAVERAEREAAGELVRAAGPDYETYLELIDLYEDRVDSGDGAGAEEVLSAIHAAMAGGYEDRELVIGDRSFGEIAARGRATSVIREAESYVTTILRRAEAEHRTFLVKLAQMRENPSVFFARERADAMIALFEGDGMQVETFLTPDLEDFQLMINDDPEIRRRVERLRNQLQRTEAMERREREALGDR